MSAINDPWVVGLTEVELVALEALMRFQSERMIQYRRYDEAEVLQGWERKFHHAVQALSAAKQSGDRSKKIHLGADVRKSSGRAGFKRS